MIPMDRRTFLAGLAGSVFVASAQPLAGALPWALPQSLQYPTQTPPAAAAMGTCWLDVAAPFVVEDPKLNLATNLLLTATCFPGVDGYRDAANATEYQILLFDAKGKEIPLDKAGKLEIPAMRPALLNMRDLAHRNAFFGGTKVHVAPSPHQVSRARRVRVGWAPARRTKIKSQM